MENNKELYLSKLYSKLKGLSEDEKSECLSYYSEYIDDSETDNIEELLGSPENLAATVCANASLKKLNDTSISSGKSLKTVFLSIGGIFAAPIAIPIALVVAILALVIIIVIIAVAFSLAVTAFALAVTGIVLLFTSVLSLFTYSTPISIICIGMSLFAMGFAILLGMGVYISCKYLIKKIAILINKFIVKGATV